MKQYGIIHTRRPNELHRGPFDSRRTAEIWIEEWIEDGGRANVFEIISREVGSWQVDKDG